MKKKLTLLFTLVMVIVFATACKKNVSSEADDIDVEADNSDITEVEIDNVIDENEEVKYNFAPGVLVCVVPDSFVETDTPGEYLHKSYPKDVSSINQIIYESDYDSTQITEEEFKTQLHDEYFEAYAEDIEINVTQYEKIMVDGRPALWIMYNFEFRQDKYNALNVIIYNGNESHYVTYMQGPDANWMDQFVDSAKSLSFVNY